MTAAATLPTSAPSPVAAPPALAGPTQSRFRSALPLLLITLFGAALRFAWLDRPGIWGDEGATYGRVTGTYKELLDILQFDGFAPLHYELYWLLSRFSRLGPWMLRLWPAIAGTATVPAIYFLARQLTTRRNALVAALLTASSAYLLYYARDAKMYAPLWLFVTLSMASFLWWHKSARLLGWLLWILTTTAAAGIHTPGLIVLAIQPIVFLVHPGKSYLKALAALVGIAVIVTGPIGHYLFFNKFAQQIDEGGWNTSMLQWIGPYNAGRGFAELVRYTSTAFAISWEWPDQFQQLRAIDPRVLRAFQTFAIALGATLLAGTLPWSRLGGWIKSATLKLISHKPQTPSPATPTPPPSQLPPNTASQAQLEGFSHLPVPSTKYQVLSTETGPYATLTILAAWIILPAYGTYVVSLNSAVPPWDLGSFIWRGGFWIQTVTAILTLGALLSLRRWLDPLRLLLVIAFIFGLCAATYLGIHFSREHTLSWVGPHWPFIAVHDHRPSPARMLWMPRYLGAIVPAVLVAGAILLMRLPPILRHLAIAGFVLANVTNFAAKVYLNPEPPVRQMLTEAWDDGKLPDATAKTILFLSPYFGPGYEPGTGTLSGTVGRYYLSSLLLDKPLEPIAFRQFFAIIVERYLPMCNNVRPRSFRDEVALRPQLQTVIYWDRGDRSANGMRDPLASVLGKAWKLDRMTPFHTYDHWTWRYLSDVRRWEYTRAPAPAATPTNPPAKPATLKATK